MAALKFRRERDGSSLTLEKALHTGGEGTIYAIQDDAALVAKIYHRPTADRVAKVRAMIASPPSDPARAQGHVSFAWPIDGVLDEYGTHLGFLMPYVVPSQSAPIFKVYNPKARRTLAQGITWEFLLRAASNLASVVGAVHDRGYVLGDLNESNVLVSHEALVTVVDCDSMQVPQASGGRFHCTVGREEYTPAELHGTDFALVDLQPYHDAFGLAVLVFQLLMEGIHPFAGGWTGPGESPPLPARIQSGDWPYGASRFSRPGLHALPLAFLPVPLQELMRSCFVTGHRIPEMRPSAKQWHDAIQSTEEGLVVCSENQQHQYGKHLFSCPWCHRIAMGLPDPFPALHVEQSPISQAPPPSKSSAIGGFFHRKTKRNTSSAQVFAIANQKGGVGKTTTTINLAACLAEAGRKTLVIDLDPQCSTTSGFGVDPYKVGQSIYEVLVNDGVSMRDVIRRDIRPNLALLPAKVALYAAEIELVYLDQREYRLKRSLEVVKDEFDFVLIDCPPALNMLTVNALTAADGVILPLQCEYFALEGMQQLLNTIRLVRDRLNPKIQLFGVVLTMYDPRMKLGSEVVKEISEHFPKEKFDQVIPRSVRLAEAPSYGQTILEHDPRSPGALAYKQLAEEVIARAMVTVTA